MKTSYLVLLCLLIATCGCRSPASRFDASVPPGYYLVAGGVKKPGLIECGPFEKTLKELIDEAGGPTHGGALLEPIRVSYSGTTNFFDINQNPQLPCGAKVHVSKALFDILH